jgi:hypothetical protein
MRPDQQCNIWDFNDEKVAIPIITLAVWASGLKLALVGIDMNGVESVVRSRLSVPASYPLDDLCQHIQTSLADMKSQLEIEE